MLRHYTIPDLADYINWLYFFHAWNLPVKFAGIAHVHACDACRAAWIGSFDNSEKARATEAAKLYGDALKTLSRLTPYTSVQAVVKLYEANSNGDDVMLYDNGQRTMDNERSSAFPAENQWRLPLLRQQQPGADGFCRCLADYIRPLESGSCDKIGIFATSTHTPEATDDYQRMLTQTLADRLAEAAAERLHEEVRKKIWAYAPDEQLSIDELHAERFQGIRPAVGYPSLPDMSLNFVLNQLLDFSQIGVQLTEHAMMQPHASVSGLMIAHPQACYFSVGEISEEQLTDYAARRHMPPDKLRPYLAANLTK